MSLRRRTLIAKATVAPGVLAVGAVLLAALSPGSAFAQADKYDKPVDLKPLIPPIFSPLPPNSQINPGALSSTPTPYGSTPAPLQQSPTQTAPGFRLSVPSR